MQWDMVLLMISKKSRRTIQLIASHGIQQNTRKGGDDGSCTVQKGMSQEINLTEIIHELPGKGMGMYLFRTGRR
jgi:hypothetical protein